MTILAMSGWQTILSVVIISACLLMMLVILIQRGRGGGLAGAFGGSGGSSAFGAKTGDVFTWITVGLAVLFLCLTVVANFVFDESSTTPTVAPGTTSTAADGAADADETPLDFDGLSAEELAAQIIEDTFGSRPVVDGDAETSSTPGGGG